MRELLVICEHPKRDYETKKILRLHDRDVEDYERKILSLFRDTPFVFRQYQIQAFNERFQEWVDIDSCQDLPADGGRLKLIVR